MNSLPNSIISRYLSDPLQVGEPDVAGSLAVFPLFGPEPRQPYVSFADSRAHGFKIGELERAASVNDVVVVNPTDDPVLLYEGEELLGSQQNRTIDVTVLVPPHERVIVPVSCVEAGRWDGRRHRESFTRSPQAAYPELRRAKSSQVSQAVAAGAPARADQQAVWNAVASKSERHGARTPTGAMHDVYESSRRRLGRLARAVRWRDRQIGTLVAIGGRFAILDHVSRPEVFRVLHGPLVQGYALDSLEVDNLVTPSFDEAREFVSLVTGCAASDHPAVGLGTDLRFGSVRVQGSGLQRDGELIQLTAFPQESVDVPTPAVAAATSVRRPSARRQR